MFKAVVITVLVLSVPIAVFSAHALWASLSWICNFPRVFPDFSGIESASFSGLFGYFGLTGLVSLWRFGLRLSPRFKPRSDEETDSITRGIISGMLACMPLMFQFVLFDSIGISSPNSQEHFFGWVLLSPFVLGITSIALFVVDLFALMEMA